MNRNARIILASGNAVAFLATIIVNYLSNAIPINGQTPGEISDKYYTLFTPAGLTFAIWGIIYLLLGIYIVYQIIDSFRLQEGATSFVDRIDIWFSAPVWASIMILIAVGLAIAQSFRRKDIFYAIVIAWACFGIYTARTNDSIIVENVRWTAVAGMGIALLSVVWTVFRKRTYLN